MSVFQSADNASSNVASLTCDGTSTSNPLRRRFLGKAGSMAAAGMTMTLPGVATASAMPAAPIQDGKLTASVFRTVLNTEFRAAPVSGQWADSILLTLTEVSAPDYPHTALKGEQKENVFSLKFGANVKDLFQDTYFLSHPALGKFAALLVPTPNGKNLRAEFYRA